MPNPITASEKSGASLLARLFLLLIRVYRYAISPMLPNRCRFYPSCSAYGLEAIQRYGAWTGGWLTLKRLSRCHPWGQHGVDMVPDLPDHHSSNCCQRKP